MLTDTMGRYRRRTAAALDRATTPVRRIWPRLPEAVVGLFALAVVLFAALTYVPSLAERASRVVTGNKVLAAVDGLLNPFRNQHVLLESGLPIYDLRIREENLLRLEQAAAEARDTGILREEMQVWVPATFIAGGRRYDVRVRLRGDLSPHWEGPKKSYRINFGDEVIVEGGEPVEIEVPFDGQAEPRDGGEPVRLGKDQINLIVPGDRDYAVAPFVGEMMREAGLVVPRYQYVVLRINGRLQGLYLEVEHFDNPLLAAYDRPETTVFGQNGRAQHFEQYTRLGTDAPSDAKLDMASLRRSVDETGDLGLPAMAVLNAHEKDPSPANFHRARAVLDWDKYLTFRAMTTLLNTNHVRFGSDNLKLFYDPSRGLLEPVPWDTHLVRMPPEPGTIDFWNTHGPDELQRSTLLDPELRLERNRILWAWVHDGGESLLARYDAIHDRLRPLAWADVLTTPIQGFKMDELRSDLKFNVERVHKVLALSSANLVYRQLAPDRAALDFSTLNFSGVRLRSITLSDTAAAAADAAAAGEVAATAGATMTLKLAGMYRLLEDGDGDGAPSAADREVVRAVARDGRVRFDLDEPVLPEVAYASDIIGDRTWEYMDTLTGERHYIVVGSLGPEARDPLSVPFPKIAVEAENAVTGAPMTAARVDGDEAPAVDGTVGVLAYDASDPFDPDAITLSRAEFLARHPAFRRSAARADAVELAGTVVISESLVVPAGVPLVIRPGADITLAPEVNVLMYGGLVAEGAADAPIRIHGDASGRPWDTFASVRPPEPVVLRHVEIRDGGQGRANGMLFTGGLAVHNGDLTLEHVRITDMQSEDGINIKNGRLEMRDTLVARTASDGIDVDFGTGFIRDSHFADTAGDGIDFSGTTDFVVAGTRVEGTGDKCVSVGEASAPTIVNNLLKDCVRGLSTKDLSNPRVAFNTFVGNDVAIEAKRKKPMFGGAGGTFVNNVFAENGTFLVEDYFSKGRVAVSHALADDPAAACPTCRVVDVVRFQDPARGDFRLAADALAGLDLAVERLDWSSDVGGPAPALPGITSPTPRIGLAR